MVVRFYSSVATPTTLTAGVNNSATTITVNAVTGFPTLFPYTLALDFENALNELVDVTAASGTTLTVTRGVDGTSATSHSAGAAVRHVASGRDYADSRAHENATTNVHGATGEIVGETGVQTLEDKTLISPTITNNTIGEESLIVEAIPGSTGAMATITNQSGFGLTVNNDDAGVTITMIGDVLVFGSIAGGGFNVENWNTLSLGPGYTSGSKTAEYRSVTMPNGQWTEFRGTVERDVAADFSLTFQQIATLPAADVPSGVSRAVAATDDGHYATLSFSAGTNSVGLYGNNGLGSFRTVYLDGVRIPVQ